MGRDESGQCLELKDVTVQLLVCYRMVTVGIMDNYTVLFLFFLYNDV